VTLKEDHRQRVLKNGVLGYIVGRKRDKVTRESRRLHTEQHYDLKSTPYITHVIKTRVMGWEGHVARMRDKRGA
jgi:hypothetical protein